MRARELSRASNGRATRRVKRQLVVTYTRTEIGGSEPIEARTANVGVGGAFVVTSDPPPPRTRMILHLSLPHVATEIAHAVSQGCLSPGTTPHPWLAHRNDKSQKYSDGRIPLQASSMAPRLGPGLGPWDHGRASQRRTRSPGWV